MSAGTMEQDLKVVEDCNLCHTTNFLTWQRWEDTAWWIKCKGCGQLGTTSSSQDEAARKWNKHVTLQRELGIVGQRRVA